MFLKDWNRFLYNRYLSERQTFENCISLYLFIFEERDGRMKGVGLGDQENSPWLRYQTMASDSNLQQWVWFSDSEAI